MELATVIRLISSLIAHRFVVGVWLLPDLALIREDHREDVLGNLQVKRVRFHLRERSAEDFVHQTISNRQEPNASLTKPASNVKERIAKILNCAESKVKQTQKTKRQKKSKKKAREKGNQSRGPRLVQHATAESWLEAASVP